MDLAQLMTMNLDQLADLPGFEPPPNGAYTLKLKVANKKINSKDAVEFAYSVIACQEQTDPSLPPAEPGKRFSESFMLDNEIGVGKFKLAAAPIMQHFGITSFPEFFAKTATEIEVFGVVKGRKYEKDGEQRTSSNVSNIRVL